MTDTRTPVPAEIWDKLAAKAAEVGGVNCGRMYEYVSPDQPGMTSSMPCCMVGLAHAAGVIPVDMVLELYNIRFLGRHWHRWDSAILAVQRRHMVNNVRVPFEEVMAEAGFIREEQPTTTTHELATNHD